ncbi:MAG: hypothetical protein SFU98_14275 [Leptospiraceae bacterium]|nr:hypothetical protein [Leptospiraceae bacterium]
MRILEDDTDLFIKPEDEAPGKKENLQLPKEKVPTIKKNQCSKCKRHHEKLYQQNLCRECLSITFKRLIKVIDSVRK